MHEMPTSKKIVIVFFKYFDQRNRDNSRYKVDIDIQILTYIYERGPRGLRLLSAQMSFKFRSDFA